MVELIVDDKEINGKVVVNVDREVVATFAVVVIDFVVIIVGGRGVVIVVAIVKVADFVVVVFVVVIESIVVLQTAPISSQTQIPGQVDRF